MKGVIEVCKSSKLFITARHNCADKCLSWEDYDVREAGNGPDDLTMIQQPDLIVLDFKMPHLCGFEVAVRYAPSPCIFQLYCTLLPKIKCSANN